MNRLLITGANGFIGRHCLAELASSGHELHAVTSRHYHFSNDRVLGDSIHWHVCDLLDADASRELMRAIRPSHLLHLAWVTTPGVYWTSPLNETWRVASYNLAEAFIDNAGERLVAAGTCAEYDWNHDGICLESVHHPRPTSPYAIAKLALSQDLAKLCAGRGVAFAWPRLFWMYGPYEPAARLIPSIILSLLQDKPASCSAGTHRRDFLHVRDVARAIAQIVDSSLTGPINVGSGAAPSIASIATMIAALMDKPHLLRLGAITSAQPEAPLVVANIDRLKDETTWQPEIPLKTGLRDTIDWWAATLGRNRQPVTAGSHTRQPEGASIR